MPKTVRITNLSRSVELADHAGLADGFLSRLRGLLGRTDLPAGDGLVIVPCNSVHMWGMKIPLDVVYLDRQGTVLRLVTDLRPGRLGPYVRRAHTVLELPVGSIAESGTEVGDQVAVERVA
ncbi:MAG: DUF192 domain-containing protein [Chloroflexi bacterium]|nr:DUF192 domain-containing protein [Chloroflexota bacterium]